MDLLRGIIGAGSPRRPLSEDEITSVVADAVARWPIDGARVLVLLPDATRTAPLPLLFRLLHAHLEGRVRALNFLVALGTHPPLSEVAMQRLLGLSAEDRAGRYRRVGLFNHRWDLPDTFATIGTIPATETEALSGGLLTRDVPVRINDLVLRHDAVIVCGPVFPHEVAGFSGGNKYFFPGIGGPEVIDFTHWLGALLTCRAVIGTRHTPVRRVIDRAAALIDRPRYAFCMVTRTDGLYGLYAGAPETAWEAAADLSARLHVNYVDQPFRQILSVMPRMYDDLWTGAKGMYKVEPVAADDAEVILYAPHITEVSYTHGAVLDRIGYHVRDYFVRQWERFEHFPWGVLAHSTHLSGDGTYVGGVETRRVRVTLATGIPEARCRRLNLGYRDPATIRPADFADREAEGVLLVPHAGEVLYRLGESPAAA